MSSEKTGGVSLPVVLAIALGSALLGVGGSLVGFLLLTGDNSTTSGVTVAVDSNISAPTQDESSDEGVAVDSNISAPTQDESSDEGYEATNSIQTKMNSYVRWTVSTYIVDRNRKCSYRDGFLDVQINVTNLSEAAIVAGEAYVVIEDLFGKEIMTLDTPIDIQIPSRSSGTIGSTGSTCFSLGNFGDEVRLKEMENPYSSTKVIFYLQRLALESGEIVSF